MDPGARFCAACGTATEAASFAGSYAAPFTTPRPLLRQRHRRFIAGICAGFAEAYGWDLNLVRVVTLVLFLFSGGTVTLAYLALWILLPEVRYGLPGSTTTGTIA